MILFKNGQHNNLNTREKCEESNLWFDSYVSNILICHEIAFL